MNIYTTVASLVSPEQSRARCKRQHILRQSLFKGFTDRINQFISDTGIRLASKLIRISRYLPLVSFKCWAAWSSGKEQSQSWSVEYSILFSEYLQPGWGESHLKRNMVVFAGRKSLKLLVVRSEILHISEEERDLDSMALISCFEMREYSIKLLQK